MHCAATRGLATNTLSTTLGSLPLSRLSVYFTNPVCLFYALHVIQSLSLSLFCLYLQFQAWTLTVQTRGSWKEEVIQWGAAMKAPLKLRFYQRERKGLQEPTTSRWAQTAPRTWRTATLWRQSGFSPPVSEQRVWASVRARTGPWPSSAKSALVPMWSSMQEIWDSTQDRHVWTWKHRWVKLRWPQPLNHPWP